MDVRNDYDFPAFHSFPTDTFVFFQDLTGEGTLVRTHNQITCSDDVESSPGIMGHFMVEEGGDRRHTGNLIYCFWQEVFKLMEDSFVSSGKIPIFYHHR